MSDEMSPPSTTPRSPKDEVIEDAVVVDETPALVEPTPVVADQTPAFVEPTPVLAEETPVVVEQATVSETEPVIATTDPASVATDSSPRVVYVQVPAAPRQLGNRGVGSLVAILSAIVFTGLLVVLTLLLTLVNGLPVSFEFLTRIEFYFPTLFFIVAFVILVLLANRAKWWAFIIGSIVVGVVVYFGSIGLGLLTQQVVLATPEQASQLFRSALGSPFYIGSALLAREVALWTGGIISRRGTRVRARNLENRAVYERELASTRAEHERAAASAATAI